MGYPESQNEMKFLKITSTNILTYLSLVAVSLIAIVGGWSSFWTESEIWNTVVVKHLFQGLSYYDFTLKPVFNFLLYLNFQAAEHLGIHPMDSARAIFAVNGLLAIFLVHRISRIFSNSNRVAFVICLLCLGNSFVIKRFFSVRSDMLVTTTYLALTWLALTPWWRTVSVRARIALFSAAAIFALGMTPKAIIPAVAWGYAFLLATVPIKKRTYWLGAGALGILTLIVAAVQPKALNFFIESFSSHSAGLSYWHPQRLEHLQRFLTENLPLVLIGLLGAYLQFARDMKLTREARAVILFANLQWLAVLVYPERLPFYLASLVPFFILVVPAAWSELVRKQPFESLAKPRAGLLLACFSLVSLMYWSVFLIYQHHHRMQKTLISWLDQKSLQLDPLKIYDPAGVIPFGHASHWFVGPNEAGNKYVLAYLKDQDIDVIIGTNKILMLGQGLLELLNEKYWTSGDGIFTRKIETEVPKGKISSEELAALFRERFPHLVQEPDHKFHVRVLAMKGLNMSQYSYWVTKKGIKSEFSNGVSLNDLELLGDSELRVPSGSRLMILPVLIETPYDRRWIEMFRFDPEY